MNSDNSFYYAFEKKFRGSRELILSRLSFYIPIAKRLHPFYPNAPILDLGCGRGEWLSLLKDNNLIAHGVDIDETMLVDCKSLNLDVKKKDALTCLAGLPDNTQSLITGFHIVEHMAFDHLQILIQESLRVLVPGGLLILETPNPDNIIVSTKNFYLDPSHIRPIPSDLLGFMVDYYGYARSMKIGLNESQSNNKNSHVTLADVLGGVSPDYSIIAQKNGPHEITTVFNEVFNKKHGVGIEGQILNFDERIHKGELAFKSWEEFSNTLTYRIAMWLNRKINKILGRI